MNMGTRFIATEEAPAHVHVKEAIVAASELDTRLIMRPLRNTERVLNNASVQRLLAKERELGPELKFVDIASELAGVLSGHHDGGAHGRGRLGPVAWSRG